MKRKLLFLFFLLVVIFTYINVSYAESEENIIEEQKEYFGISDFIKEAEQYSGDFFEDIDISSIIDNAISGEIDTKSLYLKILNILGSEIVTTLKSLVSIVVIIIIHSILKAVTDDLESNISQIIYYVQYILITTIIMNNFVDIIELVKDTSNNLVGFMNILIPILISLMLYTGSIVTSGVIEPIILFVINFLGNIINIVLVPVVLIITVISIISKISDKINIDKLSKFLKSGIVWFLGIVMTLFISIISLQGNLTSSIDGITAKTTKTVVSSVIPVVGKILGDAVDTVLGYGVILKNAIGIVGVIIILGICIFPVIKLGILALVYNLTSVIVQPIADTKIVHLLEEIGGVFKILFAILCSISVMLIIGTTLVIKISNSGMMYR